MFNMLPVNAREGDFVEVSNRDSAYFGMIGKIKQLTPTKATVDIYGKFVDIEKKDLELRARTGTGSHDSLVEQIKSQEVANLDEEGYNGLINLAIDLQEWEWAKELVDRKNKFLATMEDKKKKVG